MLCSKCNGRGFRTDETGDFVLCRECPPCEHGVSGICHSCIVEKSPACEHGNKGSCPYCEGETIHEEDVLDICAREVVE
jgi:hypothetical protein